MAVGVRTLAFYASRCGAVQLLGDELTDDLADDLLEFDGPLTDEGGVLEFRCVAPAAGYGEYRLEWAGSYVR